MFVISLLGYVRTQLRVKRIDVKSYKIQSASL